MISKTKYHGNAWTNRAESADRENKEKYESRVKPLKRKTIYG